MQLPRRPKRNHRSVRRAQIRHKKRTQRTKQRVLSELLQCWRSYSKQMFIKDNPGSCIVPKQIRRPNKTQMIFAKSELYKNSLEGQIARINEDFRELEQMIAEMQSNTLKLKADIQKLMLM